MLEYDNNSNTHQMVNPVCLNYTEDSNRGRVAITISGPVGDSSLVSEQLDDLRQLADTYDTAIVYINTPGGNAMAMIEIYNVLKLFENVITVNAGICCSSGFILWCSGTLRVSYDHSIFLAHRESYGFQGRTHEHLSNAQFSKNAFESMFFDICGGVLDDEELEKIIKEDIQFTAAEMIDRGASISYDDFLYCDSTTPSPIGTLMVVNEEVVFTDSDGNVSKVNELSLEGEPQSIFDYMYSLKHEYVYDEDELESDLEKVELLEEEEGDADEE